MKRIIPLLLSLLSIIQIEQTFAQILTTSNLPIIVINTNDDEEIPDEPKINATMGIIDNGDGQTNNINDPFNHYDGFIGIEMRGNSTQGFDKKTYTVELWDESDEEISEPLLGMGKEEDWILHAMVIDKTQLRIPYSFYLSQQMGHYAANWRYVELILNGEYRGLYILTENIKRDDDRVDIAKLEEDDISGDEVTGGYILRIDWLEGDDGFESNYESQGGEPMFYQWHYPKANKIQPAQAAYIEGWMDNFENAVFANNFTNNNGERYTDLIDLDAFTDFLLINEFTKNSDGYKLSSYLHKDRDSKGGKLVAGPIWDFDQTYGLSLVCSSHDPTGWTYLQNQDDCEDLESMPMWWQRMMEDEVFRDHLKCRWEGFRSSFLSLDSINMWIDAQTDFLDDALDRNFTQWDYFIGNSIWIEPEPIPETYEEEIIYLKSWISERLTWMDANLPGNCLNTNTQEESLVKSKAQIFPNPSTGIFHIKSEESFTTKVFDCYGQCIHNGEANTIDLNQYPDGIYYIQLIFDHSIESKLISKKNNEN